MTIPAPSQLDFEQILPHSYDDALAALRTVPAAGVLVKEAFDEIDLTYVGVTTDIATATYKLAGVTVATLTMSYDGSSRLITVVKT